jgi:hypothetical protein
MNIIMSCVTNRLTIEHIKLTTTPTCTKANRSYIQNHITLCSINASTWIVT